MQINKVSTIKKIIINICWLFFDKILRMGMGLLVVMWLARYLGAEQFGLLNFVIALVSVFGVFATLGLKAIVVRDLIDHKNSANEILGTAFILKLLGAIFVYALLLLTIFIIKPDDSLSKVLVAIYGASLLFKSIEVVSYWFESQVTYKYVVWVENSIFLVLSLVKCAMIWFEAELTAFVWVILLESVLVAAALTILYMKRVASPTHWQVTLTKAKCLLNDSWPLIISSAAWIIYTRVDQIMIGQMIDNAAVGQYSVAIKLSDMANLIPIIIASSIIPAITLLRKKNVALYNHRFQVVYDLTVGIMLLASIAAYFLSDWAVNLLFGAQYAEAASVLSIQIWSTIFVAMATVSGKYLVNEGLQKITMQRHVIGVFINIPLNYVMIPIYGIQGAAFASLFSLAFSNYIFDALTPATRTCFIHKTRAFFAYGLIQNIRTKIDDSK